jgi:PAS domain S-box-containing protein
MDEKENTRELVVVDVRRYKKVKAALKNSEERYRQLFENVPIGIYRTTPDGRIIDANPALVKMTGFASFDDLASLNLNNAYVNSDFKRADFIRLLKRDGEVKGLEYIWRTRDGKEVHVRENAKLIRGEKGEIYFEGTVEDITVSKQAEAVQRSRTQQLEIINRIISSGNTAASLDELLDSILDNVLKPLDFNMAAIFMYDPGTKKVQAMAYRGVTKSFFRNQKLMSIENMPFSQSLLRGQPVFVDHTDEGFPDLARKWKWKMAGSIPMLSKGRVVGAINVASCERAAFSPEEKNVLELIGKEAGTLISKLQTEKALRESEKYYRALIDTSPDIICVLDLKGNLTMVNPCFLQSGGYFYEEVIGHNVLEFVAGLKLGFLLAGIKKFLRTKKLDPVEYPIKKKDGTVFPMEMAISLLTNEKGEPTAIMGVGRDITVRKRAEEALSVAETRYRLLFEQSPDGIVIIDPETARLLEFNESAHWQLGYSREEFSRLSISDLEVDETPEETRSHIARVLREGLSNFETRHRTRQGEIRNIQVTAQFTKMLDRPIYHCIWRDITERKETEDRLLSYQEKLRALTLEMVLVEERERRRIAAELHDQIGQNLALCMLKVAALEKDPDHDAVKGELAVVRRLLECSIQDTRSLIFDLSPPVLYELGFAAALEWLAERMQEQFHMAVEFESRLKGPELQNDQQVILFQVVRELLMNVGKHARAGQARISLAQDGPALKIEVVDNGVGFDSSKIFAPKEQGKSFGFFSMRERLNYLGGRLEVKSGPGQGTQVILTVPLVDGRAAKENS